jgi:hypothetical protein
VAFLADQKNAMIITATPIVRALPVRSPPDPCHPSSANLGCSLARAALSHLAYHGPRPARTAVDKLDVPVPAASTSTNSNPVLTTHTDDVLYLHRQFRRG